MEIPRLQILREILFHTQGNSLRSSIQAALVLWSERTSLTMGMALLATGIRFLKLRSISANDFPFVSTM